MFHVDCLYISAGCVSLLFIEDRRERIACRGDVAEALLLLYKSFTAPDRLLLRQKFPMRI
jgi:hypothetical protein